MHQDILSNNFPILKDYLYIDSKNGICFKEHLLPSLNSPKQEKFQRLKYYYVDKNTVNIINHNLRWARGNEKQPKFQFIYLMLPNKCNQKCIGCFTGQDKSSLPLQLQGRIYSNKTLEMIFSFLKEHNVKTIVYGGGGELFTWEGAFDYIDKIYQNGFRMVIFTNGTLLNREQIKLLNSYGVSLIISIRDTIEKEHNDTVGTDGFFSTLKTIEFSLEENMNKDSRLAVEIPITKLNEERILNCLLPTLRKLNIIPLIEEYIQILATAVDKRLCHTFDESRNFFSKACALDRTLGYKWKLKYGQRIIAQPKCERPRYSFAIYPTGDVMDCPSHTVSYGNLYSESLKNIIYSNKFKEYLINYNLCPCSVFYTNNRSEVPQILPDYLELLR